MRMRLRPWHWLPVLAFLAACGAPPIGSSRVSPDAPIAGAVRPAGASVGSPSPSGPDPLERVAAQERAAAERAEVERAEAERREAERAAAERAANDEAARKAEAERAAAERGVGGKERIAAGSAPVGGSAFPPAASATPSSSDAPSVAAPRLPRAIYVGPSSTIRSIAEAARLAKDGDTIEVEAGEYRGDVAVWSQKQLAIKSVGGRAVLIADGRSAEGKGIWVVRGGDISVEGFDFVGARVPDKNGAGIRFERGNLVIRDSRFFDNENGILTGNDKVSTLVLDRCEFTRNGHPSGQSHGLYVGQIARLEVRSSYFSQARGGHLLKTRARVNEILHSRITDEDGGLASYELEFPNGGDARVIGNLIEQVATTQNSTIVSYGAEGYMWGRNRLLVAHNTIVNRRGSGGTFLKVFREQPAVLSMNNLFVGSGDFQVAGTFTRYGDLRPAFRDFADPGRYDYRPNPGSLPDRLRMRADVPEHAPTAAPDHVYRHPRQSIPIDKSKELVPGAFQR